MSLVTELTIHRGKGSALSENKDGRRVSRQGGGARAFPRDSMARNRADGAPKVDRKESDKKVSDASLFESRAITITIATDVARAASPRAGLAQKLILARRFLCRVSACELFFV